MRITSLESQNRKQTQQVATDLQAVKSSVDQLSKQLKALEAKYQQLSASQHIPQAVPLALMNGGDSAASCVETNMGTLRCMNILQVSRCKMRGDCSIMSVNKSVLKTFSMTHEVRMCA